MSTRRIQTLVTGLILAATPAAAATQPKAPPDVTVYIQASQPIAALYLATSQASVMFRSIGVEVAWVAGNPKRPAEGLALDVQLAADTPVRLLPGALARSFPYAGSDKPITVFYDRVERRAAETSTPERMLLAHVLVHEITHVLEAIDRHSATGIMKAQWTAADYAVMARQSLGFDADDVYWIRRQLHKPQPLLPVQ